MQKLICELCRSNDFTKDDQGFFVCDYCRTKYTPEQAKSMIVEGTVRVDRSGEASSLLTLASTALSAGNTQEAFDYANRALEIDPNSSTAWYLKGTAVGWLSTMQAPRLREMQHAYHLAIQNAPDDERASMLQWSAERVTEITSFVLNTSIGHVRQYPIADGIWNTHVALCEEALAALGTAYQWCPNPACLMVYVAIASDLIKGVPYRYADGVRAWNGVHVVAPAYQSQLRERIEWAGSQMRLFDPSYVTPKPKPARKSRF